MKTLSVVVIALFLFTVEPSNSYASQVVEIGISSQLSSKSVEQVKKIIHQILLYTLMQKDKLVVTNIDTLSSVPLQIPNNKHASKPKFRIKLMRKELAELNKFLKSFETQEDSQKNGMDIPRYLDAVSQRISQYQGAKIDVLLFGNPIHKDSEISFETHYPSDGMLKVSLRESPFSILGKEQALSKVRIHLLYPSESIFENSLQKAKILRFYALYMQLQGAKLITASTDYASIGERLKLDIPAKVYTYDDADSKPQFHSIIRKIPKIVKAEQPEQQNTNISQSPVASLPPMTGRLEVGIIWDGKEKDLDIWIRNKDKWVSYKNPQNGACTHMKDFRSNAKTYFETIICQSVDLKQLTTLVHLYSLNPSATLTVRVLFHDRLYQKSYTITKKVMSGYPKYWLPVSLMEILGFPERELQRRVTFVKGKRREYAKNE